MRFAEVTVMAMAVVTAIMAREIEAGVVSSQAWLSEAQHSQSQLR
jgi:hypothetical protein